MGRIFKRNNLSDISLNIVLSMVFYFMFNFVFYLVVVFVYDEINKKKCLLEKIICMMLWYGDKNDL